MYITRFRLPRTYRLSGVTVKITPLPNRLDSSSAYTTTRGIPSTFAFIFCCRTLKWMRKSTYRHHRKPTVTVMPVQTVLVKNCRKRPPGKTWPSMRKLTVSATRAARVHTSMEENIRSPSRWFSYRRKRKKSKKSTTAIPLPLATKISGIFTPTAYNHLPFPQIFYSQHTGLSIRPEQCPWGRSVEVFPFPSHTLALSSWY